MRKIAGAAIGAVLAIVAGTVHAEGVTPVKPEDAIKYRQSAMFLMSQHVGAMAAMVRGDRPMDQSAFANHAMLVDQLGRLPTGAFMVPGTDKAPARLKASPAAERAKYDAAEKRFHDATTALVNAAKGGDQGAIRTAFGGVGGACKNCHEGFRGQ